MIRIRASSLDTLKLCPRKFHFTNFTQIPGIGSRNMIIGTAVHAGIAKFWEDRTKGTKMEHFACADAAEKAYREELQKRRYDVGDGDIPFEVRWLPTWYSVYQYRTQEQALGWEWELYEGSLVEGMELTGHTDLVTKDWTVVDHKIVKRAYSQGVADRSLQLSAYAVLLGLGSEFDEMKVRLDCLEYGGKDVRLVIRESKRTLNSVLEVQEVLKDIKQRETWVENYPAKPMPLCASCPYRGVCLEGSRYLRVRGIPLFQHQAKAA